jgi:hypothetical protein
MTTAWLDTYLVDMRTALLALWPDRPVVYFTAEAFEREEQGPGYLLSDEEREQLARVAAAIGSARAGEDA